MMDPSSIPLPDCDDSAGADRVPDESNVNNKTDNNAASVPIELPNRGSNIEQSVNQEQIDDIEREDFEEENRLIKHCSGIIAQKLTSSPRFVGNITSANNCSIASTSETISSHRNAQPGPSQACCSRRALVKEEILTDSNSIIKSMIHPRKLFPNNSSHTSTCGFRSRSSSGKFPSRVSETVEHESRRKSAEEPNSIHDVQEPMLDIRSILSMSRISKSSHTSASCKSGNGPAASSSKNMCQDKVTESRSVLPNCTVTHNRAQELCCEEEDSDEEYCCYTCQEAMREEDDPSVLDYIDVSADDKYWRKRRGECSSLESAPVKKYCADYTVNLDNSAVQGTSLSSAVMAKPGPPELSSWLLRFNTWSHMERIQAIDALIGQSAASQVRHMLNAIEPLFQRDFISLLPKELALSVLGYLGAKDLLRAAQTCRYWRVLADDNLLWKEQCHRVGITKVKARRSTQNNTNLWKAEYMREQIIESNWVKRPVTEPIVMKGHDDHVITCLQFYGDKILSGSDDNTLKIWSARTGRCLRTLIGHTGGVWSSQMVGNMVISGSTDRTLRVWDARTGYCLKVLTGHTSTVRCMHLNNILVVSGSRDATLRVWSVPLGQCLRVLVGHSAAVRCVQFDGKIVVSGAYDNYIKIWNPHTGKCLHTLIGHTNRVYSLQFDGVHVVSGSLDTSICVWDVQSGQLKHTLYGHQSLTSGMELHSNILVSGNADSTVKVWDINTGQCLHTLSGPNKHMSAVTCLQSTKRFVITSSDDGTVKLWDVRTGEFIRNLVVLESGGSGGVVWRIRASSTKLICAVGSRNGAEETKLLVLNFDLPKMCHRCHQ